MNQLDAFDATYLHPLRLFNTVVKTIADVHPYAKMALGVLSWASQLLLTQADRDASISNLLIKILQLYQFITEDDRLSRLAPMTARLTEPLRFDPCTRPSMIF